MPWPTPHAEGEGLAWEGEPILGSAPRAQSLACRSRPPLSRHRLYLNKRVRCRAAFVLVCVLGEFFPGRMRWVCRLPGCEHPTPFVTGRGAGWGGGSDDLDHLSAAAGAALDSRVAALI